MSRRIENDCVGCPQGCIYCGRNKNYYVFECDGSGCFEETNDYEEFFHVGNKDYCKSCYKDLIMDIESRR